MTVERAGAVTVIARFPHGRSDDGRERRMEFGLTCDGLMRLRHVTDLLWAEHLIRRCIEWWRGFGTEPPSAFTARMPGGYQAHLLTGDVVDLDVALATYADGDGPLHLYLLPVEE